MLQSERVYASAVLSNGLRVVYRPSDSPVAYCGLAVNAGTRDEPPGQSGLAHFVEHALFKGTEKRKSRHILNRMESVGGELNAYTAKEETILYTICLSEDAGRAVELLSDLAFCSQFPEAEIDKEREVILDEIRSCEDNPSEAIADEFENILFSGSEMGRLILGDETSLRAITSADCRAFTGAFYHPENMVFFFYGKVPWKKIMHLAEKYLGGMYATGCGIRRKRVTPAAVEPVRKKMTKELHQSHVMVGSRGYGLYDDKRMGLCLLNNLLGGPGMNSRLNVSLREKRGLVYTVDSVTTSYSDTGVFSIYFGCDHESAQQCLRLIYKELQVLRDKALTSSQLQAAVKQLKGQIGVSADHRENVALGLGKSFLHYNKYDSLPEIYDKLDALTSKQLLEIANEIFDENRLFRLIFE
ncbi:MAG: insulinase family protein [Dysgonamonadaceae bacterium]|jgi:predicted Zn-dependent peptidase|nr:insulinase family protein [Dysgonamonadaceae bacterium]